MAAFRIQSRSRSLRPPSRRRAPAWRSLRRRLGGWLQWLWRQEGSPGQRARGLASGVFLGCFPFFGLQIVLSVALASLVRGNHLLAAAGTWISNPLTYVPLYWFNYQVGSLLLGPGGGWPGLALLRSDAVWRLGWSFATRMLLGSALVGVVAAALVGLAFWVWLHRGTGRAPMGQPGDGGAFRNW